MADTDAASESIKEDCPCKKHRCSRWGHCAECRAFHHEKNSLTACERPPKEPHRRERTRTR